MEIHFTIPSDAYRGAYVDVQDSAIRPILSRRSTELIPNRTEYINNDKSLTPTMNTTRFNCKTWLVKLVERIMEFYGRLIGKWYQQPLIFKLGLALQDSI
jgi:hypothetical protein